MAKYDESFWGEVLNAAPRVELLGTLLRLVENQQQKVTVALVDGLDEQALLESLLEESKPTLPRDLERFDYLLRSPWRYPPLPWGSRFGRRFEPGLFYGALSITALLAEAAYYRFVLLEGMETPFAGPVISQHTRFEAQYRTDRGLRLSEPPFDEHQSVLRDRSDYRACQALGSAVRNTDVHGFIYFSARTRALEQNIALVVPAALRSRRHRNPQSGLCELRPNRVQFRFAQQVTTFDRDQFLVDDHLPAPAA